MTSAPPFEVPAELAVDTARQVAACVRGVVAPLRFPTKKSFNTIVVPFYFQHTTAPGAGPQLSCWDARGCH